MAVAKKADAKKIKALTQATLDRWIVDALNADYPEMEQRARAELVASKKQAHLEIARADIRAQEHFSRFYQPIAFVISVFAAFAFTCFVYVELTNANRDPKVIFTLCVASTALWGLVYKVSTELTRRRRK